MLAAVPLAVLGAVLNAIAIAVLNAMLEAAPIAVLEALPNAMVKQFGLQYGTQCIMQLQPLRLKQS